jgi:hypothetical protein
MRRLRPRLVLLLAFLLAALAIWIIGLGPASTAPASPPPAPPAQPASLALPVSSGSIAPSEPRDTSPGTFDGHVLDADTGVPIPGAELTFSQGGVAASVRAGQDGAYLFRPPAAGRWLLAAVGAVGYFPFAPEWGFSPIQLDASPGRRVVGLNVFLSPAVEIVGLVVDEDGLPVAGAEVRLLGTGGRATLIPIPSRFTTGGDGRFKAAAPLGSVLEARKEGYFPGHAGVDRQALLDGLVEMTLGRVMDGEGPGRAALSGTVVGPDGQPIVGALVEAARTHGWAYGGSPVAQAVTDADGRFRIDELTRSPHLLTARADGFVTASAGRVLPGGAEVRIAMSRGGQLHGCVRDAGSAPVAPYGVRVYLDTNSYRSEPDLQLSVADPSGCFLLAGMPIGGAIVVVLAPGFSPSTPLNVTIPAPPARAEVEIPVAGGGVVTGAVRDEVTGAPLASARVLAEAISAFPDALQPDPPVSETTTGPDGAFRLQGLPPRVRVVARAAGHHVAISTELTVPAGIVFGPVDLALRPQQEGDVGPIQPVGIGAVLRPEGEGVVVGALRPGSPAERSGLTPGDELLEIDGHAVAGLGMAGAVEGLRGPEGTTAFLTVRRGNGTLDLEVPRRRGR